MECEPKKLKRVECGPILRMAQIPCISFVNMWYRMIPYEKGSYFCAEYASIACGAIGDSTKRDGQVWIVSNSYTEKHYIYVCTYKHDGSDQKCYYVKTIPYRWETMLPENEYYYILGIPIPKGPWGGVSEQRRGKFGYIPSQEEMDRGSFTQDRIQRVNRVNEIINKRKQMDKLCHETHDNTLRDIVDQDGRLLTIIDVRWNSYPFIRPFQYYCCPAKDAPKSLLREPVFPYRTAGFGIIDRAIILERKNFSYNLSWEQQSKNETDRLFK